MECAQAVQSASVTINVMPVPALASRLSTRLVSIPGVIAVSLGGSHARGAATPILIWTWACITTPPGRLTRRS